VPNTDPESNGRFMDYLRYQVVGNRVDDLDLGDGKIEVVSKMLDLSPP
jgi:hypothetical protein